MPMNQDGYIKARELEHGDVGADLLFFCLPKGELEGKFELKVKIPKGSYVGLRQNKHKLFGKLGPVWKGEAGPELLDLYNRQRHKAAADFTQTQTIANKKLLEERDPTTRKQRLDDLRRTGDDPKRARAYMRRAALVESLESAALVT